MLFYDMGFAFKEGINSMIFTFFKGRKKKFLLEETSDIANLICRQESEKLVTWRSLIIYHNKNFKSANSWRRFIGHKLKENNDVTICQLDVIVKCF